MTLFCFFWHRFRGHGADSPCLPSLDTFPCHTGEDGSLHKHTVAGAPTRFLRLQCSRSLVIVYTVTLDWLAAEQFCQNSERSYRLYSVQYSVQVYSAVYYWCTVDTWSLHAVRACAVHTTASYVNIDRAYYVCSAGRIGRKD